MVICPKCQTENRSGAKFCKNCAAALPVSPSTVTLPLDDGKAKSAATIRLEPGPTTPIHAAVARTDTRPLSAGHAFVRRPNGAVFGDTFLHKGLVFSDAQQNQYLVSQFAALPNQPLLVCPSPTCGAFFPPRTEAPEKFCTDCGTVLIPNPHDLMLVETPTPLSTHLQQIIAKGLSHSSVRAPLGAFEESVAGVLRYCMLTPPTNPLDGRPERNQALHWSVELARGLDYLHDNGLTFNGRVEDSCFALVNSSRAVWANFANCALHPEGYVTDRLPDVRALALLVFRWLTGKAQYEHDPNLMPGVSQVFEQAFAAPGFVNGSELALAFEQAAQEAVTPQAVDYHTGRRTSVGMVRSLNEDSTFTVEINRIQQSVSQPLGVYVVADGMGGHAAGEIASGTIVNTIAQKALTELLPAQITQGTNRDHGEWLRQAVEAANRAVFEMRKSAGTDMGSTLVAAVLEGSKAWVAHVGDSRVYLINARGIQQITIDHSLVERLIATHQITREEARHHPQRNVIYRTVGDKLKVDAEISTHNLSVGDYLLLCSDGLCGMVDDQAMLQIVRQTASPQAACDELIAAANAAGGEDNISVVIVAIIQA